MAAKWQTYSNGNVQARWALANEWLTASIKADPEFKITGYYMFPDPASGEPWLVVEFESDIIAAQKIHL